MRDPEGGTRSVCVVVVTWNAIDDIPPCIESLRRNTDYPSWRLLVIDNASSDGTVEWLRTNVASHEVLTLDRNQGWVRSLNIAVSREKADYFFFLNPDTSVGSNWLSPLVEALEVDPQAGFAAPKFLYPDGSIHYAGARVGSALAIEVVGHGERDTGQYDWPAAVPFAHGQCLVRAEVLQRVGPYDEGFGLGYFEEADLQLRALRLGYKANYVPRSTIVHRTAASFDRHPGGLKEELLVKNWLRVVTLHWPPAWIAARVPLELARPFRAMMSRKDPRPILRAWGGWLRDLPAIWKKRRAVRSQGTIAWSDLRHGRNATETHFDRQ